MKVEDVKGMLTEKIKDSYEKLVGYVEEYFEDDRRKKIFEIFTEFKTRMITDPASGKSWYHSAYVGGWLYHTATVIDYALQVCELWEKQGVVIDFDKSELVFAAIFHDFGKLGDGKEAYYIRQNSDWHRKRGMIYDFNPKLQYMPVPERSLFILQSHGIKLSLAETLGIKLSDGLYDEGNKAYLTSYREGGKLKTLLPYIIHQADMMAAQIESHVENQMDEDVAKKIRDIF